MVRQDELPWQGRATVLLDVRRAAHTPDEPRAGGVGRGQHRDRLRGDAATSSGFVDDRRHRLRLRGAAHAHVEAIMEHLATVDAERHRVDARGARQPWPAAGRGGALVVVVGRRAPAELDIARSPPAPVRAVTRRALRTIGVDRAPFHVGAIGSTNVLVAGRTSFA